MTYNFYVKGTDFSEWDKKPNVVLVKVDKNGTRHYAGTICPKCGGTGHIDCYTHVDGGICFLCGGSGDAGKHNHKYTVRTEDQHKIYMEKKQAKDKEKAIEANKKLLEKEGFTPDGRTWIVLGDTWKIKDSIKAAGGFYNDYLGWHFNHFTDEFPVKEISISEPIGHDEAGNPINLFWVNDYDGGLMWQDCIFITKCLKAFHNEYFRTIAPATEWFGEVGDKATIKDCDIRLVYSCETVYGYTNLYQFTSPAGYVFTWKTANSLDIDPDKKVTVSGKIKALTEYKGIKQTELTRCKVLYC